MPRALILSCSKRKRPDRAPLPAVERYDGPAFRVLRRCKAPYADPVVRIISAQFGMIEPSFQIEHYDRKMTEGRTGELKQQVTAAVDQLWRMTDFDELMVCASEPYLTVLDDGLNGLPDHVRVHVPKGSIGGRISQLRDWLHGEPPEERVRVVGHAELRGKRVKATPEDVFDAARHHLRTSPLGAHQFETWCVQIDDLRVSPKWLVSMLTGLPVSRFRTADALLVLRRLGVKVFRPNSALCWSRKDIV